MNALLLTDQRILIVDDEPDVLTIIKAEIGEACPDCQLETATTYQEALDKIVSWTYDLVILDIMGVRGFDLLNLAVKRNFPVAMLTAHALSPEALKRSIDLGARAYLPKEKLGELVPFLEDVLRYDALPGWKRLFEKLGDFFNKRFGPDWQQPESRYWKEFNEKLETDGTSYVKTPYQKLGFY
jgi:DNA-binding response OmpR family regulator